MGKEGRGTPEHCGVMGRIDIITSTLGKALGGASGGFTAANKVITELLRQRSRPYLFSNALAPSICEASLKALELLEADSSLINKLKANTAHFRKGLEGIGLDVLKGEHPIVPVMLYDAKLASDFAERMLEKGVYVIGFSYPVVPMGRARIRTQVSAAHSIAELDFAINCFKEVKEELGV
ncbi:MAG: 2-amino-3-ketobutyrate coenzyme A ligase [Firmicutes bacterium ADurb.Bin356]|nr:MAG: 2-amino-3-ketobutyrate coenzyme A ligase [Firmicutes bacterium ADurb.Bin356]